MKIVVVCWSAVLAALLAACISLPPPPAIGTDGDRPSGTLREAPGGFDNLSNGLTEQAVFDADREAFDDTESLADGLGPLYNAQSCRECHQNPVSGAASQVTELRAGLRNAQGRFEAPRVPIARGRVVISGRTLINDRAVCPSGEFPNEEIQQRVPDEATIRTQRLSLGLLGDGFVEAVPDETLQRLAERQCRETQGRICGQVVEVPVLEAPGTYRAGRFGWKAQHASLLSFAADAYLNEMGITSRLLPDEVTTVCDGVADPEDRPESAAAKRRSRRAVYAANTEFSDIDRFARFARATKVPPRDETLAASEPARRGSALFDASGCATCHVRHLATAPAGTPVNGGTLRVPPALGDRVFHPFGDFLLHDVGTGDGIETAVAEHHGRRYLHMQEKMGSTANRLRTPPLWGLRLRSRLMHDGLSLTVRDAIGRHRGEAGDARRRFEALGEADKQDLLVFLRSL